jgi:pimeloyl-ACP methyl ester carboxylesterase
LPDAELVIFPNSSHSPHLEEPDAYFDVIARFLERVQHR